MAEAVWGLIRRIKWPAISITVEDRDLLLSKVVAERDLTVRRLPDFEESSPPKDRPHLDCRRRRLEILSWSCRKENSSLCCGICELDEVSCKCTSYIARLRFYPTLLSRDTMPTPDTDSRPIYLRQHLTKVIAKMLSVPKKIIPRSMKTISVLYQTEDRDRHS